MNEIVQQNGGGAPAEQPSGNDILTRRVEELARSVGQIGQTVQSFATSRQQTEQEQQAQALVRDAEAKAKQAEDKLRQARESGDFEQELAAQREFSRAIAEQTRVEGEVRVFMARQEQLRKAPQLDDSGLRAFQDRNKWFGSDQEMTNVAVTFAKEIERTGVVKGSPAYFQEVERRVKERFPDRMGSGTPPVAGSGGMGGSGGNANGAVRFTPEQLQTWRSMGIDTSNPDNLKALAGGRDEAVRRNLLPQTPPSNLGRVVLQR